MQHSLDREVFKKKTKKNSTPPTKEHQMVHNNLYDLKTQTLHYRCLAESVSVHFLLARLFLKAGRHHLSSLSYQRASVYIELQSA